MTVIKIKETYNNASIFLKTDDKSIIRRFIFLFKTNEDKVVFTLLYRHYIKKYLFIKITREDLYNSILNEKTNQLFHESKNTIFEMHNLKKTIYKNISL
jgi:hypothetical protein